MELKTGDYNLKFVNGGYEVIKNGQTLYFNRKPMYASIKTVLSITEFYEAAYDEVTESGGVINAKGVLKSPTGSELSFQDIFEVHGKSIKINRTVKVLKNTDDYGFASKIGFVLASSDNVRDYDYFAPAAWYKNQEYGKPYNMGFDMDCEYFWRREANFTLPLFAAQNKASGETAMLSRWAADVPMRNLDFMQSEHVVDRKFGIGSIGISKPESKTLNLLYYGFTMRKDIETVRQGLSLDYIYPGVDGQMPRAARGYNVDYMEQSKTMTRIYHPMEEGFSHNYSVAVDFSQHDGFYPMMKNAWRTVYQRLKDPVFKVDQEKHYKNCMKALTKLTRQYGDSWGLPFSCQLPQMDVSSVSFQFGFVGQQPGIGYQLIRYGDMEKEAESFQKGVNIIDFWTRTAMSEFGAPHSCYNPTIKGFEPMPFWTRMIADGLENILDAYVYMKKKGEEKPAWLDFCSKAAGWLVRMQNDDGSWYRAYNTNDNTMRMDSKANTISVVRFLIQYYLVTKDEKCKEAALKAGEWAYENTFKKLEYRGSTCDNTDILDNESGIYAIFGFLALYDFTGEQKYLDALIGAADFTETWTYMWSFPMRVLYPNHPFTKRTISGMSPVVLGGGHGDMYMAACAYVYYRLYVITGDDHYRDYAEFIHNNTRQANDVDGSFGFAHTGLSHEGGGGYPEQNYNSHFHWLPWVTYVEIDPTSRLYDSFGAYDIAGAEKLSPEERVKRNKIYDYFI